MSVTPTPINDTGINNILNFMTVSNSQVQLVIVVGIFIIFFISVGYIFKRRKR
jgi:hypothetical protein